ncbi:MAG TPA: trypsin-like peptidase domain-containing protein [Patescibacteria group bacterium]|nr:trypsin-like peptidase domain-containing protein [Patescibacteria group bacterium]
MKIKVLLLCALSNLLFLGSFIVFTPKVSAATKIQNNYDYELVYQSPYPSTLKTGELTNVSIEIKNIGTSAWLNNGNKIVRLGSGSQYGSSVQQKDYPSEFVNNNWLSPNRPAALNQSQINPGDIATFQFDIKAPSNPGIYKAYFTPVVDGLTWMKDIGIYWQIEVLENDSQTKLQGKDISTPISNVNTIEFTVAKVICREDAKFKYLSQGSGTLFRNLNNKYTTKPFFLATNLHIVKTNDNSISKCVIQVFLDDKNDYLLYKSEGYKTFNNETDFAIINIESWNEFDMNDIVFDQIASYAKIPYSASNFAGVNRVSNIALNDGELSGTIVNIGDSMALLGYPSFGGENITVTFGNDLGKINYLGINYIKTDAKVGPGFSGGLAINNTGKLIGIPSLMAKNNNGSALGYILYFHDLKFLN